MNVLAVLPGRVDSTSGGLAWLSTRVSLQKTDARAIVPATQGTFDQQGRGFARSTTLAALNGHEEDHGDAPNLITKSFDPADDAALESPYRWGMTIDLDSCAGCNACIAACAQENNIPAVGPRLVAQGREMHWIRLERYVEEHDGQIEVRHSPMLCQHCGAAPCENVCPVLATVHGDEGLNVMVYNRCIGTRYCSNNCPYKVRRYNWFDYQIEGWPEPMPLMLNPDVTVRGQGVMEKCTFCIQRIQSGRLEAKGAGQAVPADGSIRTACQQTCPTDAIVFGNRKDEKSRVNAVAERNEGREYRALHVLNTRPAISYLAKLRREKSV